MPGATQDSTSGGAMRPRPRNAAPYRIALGLLCALAPAAVRAQEAAQSNEYFQMSLEELGDFRVTSVSKKEERLADAAASVYVITGDAIRRSGARSLPEALRLAPNLQVARIDAQRYAISARGFNSSTANKLLVMIDGRTVYTPLYSGVFWDAQATMLADIDRIEVVSGPGGTIWGTNAVNGVINIITRDAAKSGGALAQAGFGGDNSGVAARHGGALGDGHYRLYASADRWRHTESVNGDAVPDAWRRQQAGFRADWHGARGDVSLLGDLYRGTESQAGPGKTTISGASLLLRWDHPLDGGARLGMQTYLDHTGRDVPGAYGESLTTADAELRYTMTGAGGVETILGGGYRLASDHVRNSPLLAFLPARRKLHWANLYAQQQRELARGLRLIGGVRLESNDHTGLEWLPSVKLAWKSNAGHTLWATLARVVRAPSRLDTDLYSPAQPPFALAGGPGFKSELANKAELGWRGMAHASLSYSATLFHSRYHRLRSVALGANGAIVFDNQIAAAASGLEAWGSYQPAPGWTLDAGLLLQRQRLRGPVAVAPPGNDPRHQFSVASKWNLGAALELDVAARRVGALATPAVPAYTAVDASVGWRLSPALDLRLSAADLFHRRGHVEFRENGLVPAPAVRIQRTLTLALTARFP
ncbi:TonB-dependent receptor plug domain-containing protein [Pseudoduganella namucuonensis]|uniref:Iron complex outermembrane recepter protein n=1 Tax=Pseudoduganella namucuonensis TaxID=1035707 RepID=A0A1I7EXD9_9BURK|nr:TonB-dependent receptor [Pseudoduganella namucuonensis]SFU28564.1 iron complex outermembrane recepter protein [Pseudoduganella namucuonensis]